jgi:hypothetical protein
MIRFPLRPRLWGTAEHADFVRQIYGLAETRIAKLVGRAAEVDQNTRRADLDMDCASGGVFAVCSAPCCPLRHTQSISYLYHRSINLLIGCGPHSSPHFGSRLEASRTA